VHRIDESDADKKERLEKWQKYLESEDAKKEIAEKNQQSDEVETPKGEGPETASSLDEESEVVTMTCVSDEK
jgi:hypothetical protein